MTIKQKAFNSTFIRWIVLGIIAVLYFASYYFYDVYSGIKVTLQAETGISNAEYGLYYGAYSFTNVFLLMTLFGGIILDKWGIRKTGILFVFFMVVGAIVTAYGASTFFNNDAIGYSFCNSFLKRYSPQLKMMIFGRMIFGLGAETANVVINKICAKWFKGKELALSLALSVGIARIGTATAFVISPYLITNNPPCINIAAWLGAMIVFIGFLAFLLYTMFDLEFDKRIPEDENNYEVDEFHIKDLFNILKTPSFIYISLLCVLFYAAIFPFLGFLPDLLHNKYGFSLKESGNISALLPYGTVIFTPLFGWLCDKKGKSASLMILGSFILIVVYLVLAFTAVSPYIPLFLLGIAFSLVPAAMWPSVVRLVKESQLGTAYGALTTIQNFGMMIFPFFIGKILDATNKNLPEGSSLNYNYAILMLVGLGIVSVVCAILLKLEDKKTDYGLELPNIQT